MNKSVKIKVKTPVGVTELADVHGIVAQGSVDSGVISAVNTSKGTDVAFASSDGEVEYLGVELGPLILMDDIARMSDNVDSAQDGNKGMEHMLNSKGLVFNLTKSKYLVMGSKMKRNKMKKELGKKPLDIV